MAKKKGNGGAYNPNLVAYDPNSGQYMHGDPAAGSFSNAKLDNSNNDDDNIGGGEDSSTSNTVSATWSPCPTDPSFEGDRASHDCSSYTHCAGGQARGGYKSCLGLKFDNERKVCDWAESVTCASADSGSESVGGDGGSGSNHVSKEIGSATQIAVATADTAGSNGATANNAVTGWGGSDWGGSWINGVWVDDADSANSQSGETAWLTHEWEPTEIIPYPPHAILPCHIPTSATAIASSSATLPRAYTSHEGWSSSTRSSVQNGSPKTVVGYYAAWQSYDNDDRALPKNMQFSKVDRVNFAFFQMDEEGNVWGTDSWADPIALFGPHDWSIPVPSDAGHAPQFIDDNGFSDTSGPEWNYLGDQYVNLGANVFCHRSTPTGKRDCNGHSAQEGLIGRAHSQGALVYPSIGGWSLSNAFPKLSASVQGRRNFAKNCVGLIREYNFDGIDIDWEFPGYAPHDGTPADRDNFVLLLQDIRSALDAYTNVTYPNGERTFGLTAALPCSPHIIDSQDVPAVSAVLSELNLMTYDFHGTWDDLVGVNAPLYDQPDDGFYSPEYSVHGCVERWVSEGADKSKINLGLPFYGRSYSAATKLYESFDGADGMNWWADEGQPQYYNILDKLPDMISVRDDVTRTQYAYFEEDGGIISFDDNQAICDKVEYARSNELHGFLIWELSGDMTEDLRTPLLDVVNYKLERGDDMDCEIFRLETRDENGEIAGLANSGEPNPWYVSWEEGSCVNDGKQPAWAKDQEDLFRRKEECCGYKFEYKFDACVGPPTYEPTKKPTKEPTLSPIITESPTDGPTLVFGAAQVFGDGSPSPVSRSTEVSPDAPITFCFGGCKNANEKCVGNQNHPQNINDNDCKACQGGQTFWPCDVDGLCFCWDPSTPRIPPAPGSGLAQLSNERPCDYFKETTFNSLAPEAEYPYTYEGFCKAIDSYNEGHAEKIFMMGTEKERKSELASFLGHTLHESDEWRASREYLMCADHQVVGGVTYCKPCDSGGFNWETFKCDGVGLAGGGLTFNGYCDHTIEPPAACACDGTLTSEPAPLEGYIPASKVFFGRGAIQLSWNYNFRAASEALTGDPTTFCEDPDLVATTPEYAWGAGVFFWMENLKEETTCHIEALKNHDFGGTLNNINGGLECPAYHGGWHGEAIKLRLNRYCKASAALDLDSILVFEGCKGLNTSFAECLGDGTCPDCNQYSDGTSSFVSHTVTTHTDPIPPTPSEPVTTPDSTPNPTPDPTPYPTPQPAEVIEQNKEEQTIELDELSPSCPAELMAVDGLPGCCVPETAYHGDGACDPDSPYNTAECDYDGGDCCQETCDLDSHYACSLESSGYGPFGYFCINSVLDEYIDPELCTVSDRTRIGDGRCDADDEMYNSEACNWDGGDCCTETCNQRYAHFDCGVPAYDCQNPDFVSFTAITPIPTDAPSPRPVEATTKGPTTPPKAPPTAPPTAPPIKSTELSADSEASIVTVIASADATIMKGSPDSNHGGAPILKVKGLSTGPNAHDSILRFVIPASGLSASTPVDAVLKIYSLSDAQHGGIFHVAETSSWSEDDVTWNNAPASGARIGSIGEVEEGNWYTIDTSEAVSSLNGNEGEITIRIRSRHPKMVEYGSKETLHKPVIIVAYGSLASSSMADSLSGDASAPTPVTPDPTPNPNPKPTRRPTPQPILTTTTTTTTSTVVPGLHILTPSDDATIVSEHPDQNYGSENALQVDDDSGVYDSLIRFDLSDIETSAVESATLRLYCTDGSNSGGIFGKTVVSNWNEASVTWSNAPAAFGSPIHSLGPVQTAKWYEIDVIDLFSGGSNSLDAVSIRITSNSWNRAGYSSKEGPEPPQLVLFMEDTESHTEPMGESKPDGIVCTTDIHTCPNGSFVSRVAENGCNFAPCLDQMDYGTGLFFPIWETGGAIACVDGTAPSWARGAYLKESKSDCCQTFFSLHVDECLGA